MLAVDIRGRRRLGIERYGTELQPHNGRDAVRDAYEETLDLWMYLVQLVEEEVDTCALVDLEAALFTVINLAGSLRQLLYLRERYQ